MINLDFLSLVTINIRMNTIKVKTITAAATDVIIAAILTPVLLDTVIFVACVVRTVSTAYF